MMVLMFIASAFGGECNSKLMSKEHVGSYNVYVCHEDLIEPTEKAIRFWSGIVDNNFILHKGIYHCSKYKSIGDILVDFNDSEVELYLKESEEKGIKIDINVYAVTSFIRNKYTKDFKYSTISISTKTPAKESIDVLTAHELGHAIGYGHINRECKNHVMNPLVSGMSYDFH